MYYDSLCGVSLWQRQLDPCFKYKRDSSLSAVPTQLNIATLCAWLDAVIGHVTKPFLFNFLGNVSKQKQAAILSSKSVLVVQPVHLCVLNLKCFTSETTTGPSILLTTDVL